MNKQLILAFASCKTQHFVISYSQYNIVGGFIMIDKIKDVLSKQLRISIEEIDSDASIMEDLGADSLDVVEMLMTLEDQFNTTIPDEDVPSLKTVRDIAEYLENNMES